MRAALDFVLAATGIGDLICASKGHAFAPPENRWPELGADGVITQCQRCLHIERYTPQKDKA